MTEQLILGEIEQNREEYIEFLRDLIQAKSVNPPGNEMNAALVIEKFLKESDVNCEILPFGENRANILAYLNNKFSGKTLLYNGHIDVVPIGSESDWKYPPFSATVKRNKTIYGRGAADMKGGIGAMVVALRILKKLDLNLTGNLIVNPVADEEKGGKHGTITCIEEMKKKAIQPDFTVVGEPTGFSSMLPKAVLVGEKGQLHVKVTTFGKSAHSSVPFIGINAIHMMGELIGKLDNVNNYIPDIKPPIPMEKLKKLLSHAFPNEEAFKRIYDEQPIFQHLLRTLTEFTKTFTMINGGIKENVIPDKCEATINFRLLASQEADSIITGLKKLIETELGYEVKDEVSNNPKDIYFHLGIVEQSNGSYWQDWESSSILNDFKEVIGNVYGKSPFVLLLPAGADSKHIRDSGLCPQTVIFGPGDSPSSHGVDESIEIEDYINAIKVYTLFAYNYLK